MAREKLSAQELYKRSLRVRLTRAGLVKIMEANEAMERKKKMTTQRDKIRDAISEVLSSAGNYPVYMQAAVWGAHMGDLVDKATDAVMNTALVEQTDMLHNRPDVTRVLVADQHGVPYQTYRASKVATSLQDDGRTLKVFLRDNNK